MTRQDKRRSRSRKITAADARRLRRRYPNWVVRIAIDACLGDVAAAEELRATGHGEILGEERSYNGPYWHTYGGD